MTDNNINDLNEYKDILYSLSLELQDNYHNFTSFYIFENILLNTNTNLLYKRDNYSKIGVFWEEIGYISDYTKEGDYLIYFLNSANLSNTIIEDPKFSQDLDNFLFYEKKPKERIYTNYIKLLHYISNNYEFILRRLYLIYEEDIYNDFKVYIGAKMTKYKILDNAGAILYIVSYIIVIIFLFHSNQIIIKNIIFIFLDFNEEGFKNKNNFSNMNLKLNGIKQLIEDFDLNGFEKYNKNEIYINKSLYNNENNRTINKKEESIKKSIKNSEKESYDKMSINSIGRNKFLDGKNKGQNNSSYNNLYASNSQLFKVDIKNNSNELDKNLALNINTKKINEENEDNIQELILNSSNKTCILWIIIYFITLTILIMSLIFFSYYKIIFNMKMNSDVDAFFINMRGITDRYSILFYSFNIFRTLLIFPGSEKKKQFEEIMEKIEKYYEEENKKFLEIRATKLMKIHFYRVTHLLDELTESKNNSTEKIKNLICDDNISCKEYLNSKNNIFDSGMDFGFKSALTYIYLICFGIIKISKIDII